MNMCLVKLPESSKVGIFELSIKYFAKTTPMLQCLLLVITNTTLFIDRKSAIKYDEVIQEKLFLKLLDDEFILCKYTFITIKAVV